MSRRQVVDEIVQSEMIAEAIEKIKSAFPQANLDIDHLQEMSRDSALMRLRNIQDTISALANASEFTPAMRTLRIFAAALPHEQPARAPFGKPNYKNRRPLRPVPMAAR